MGQDQSKGMRCGAYQQEPPVQVGGDAALRIRRQLQQSKVKPQQPNFSVQQYQTVPSPSSQTNLSNQPSQQTIPNQQTRKNIEIKPPRDMIRQQNQRRASLNRNKSVDSKPPKPKSARPPVAPAPKPDIQHENIIRLSKQPFPNCVKTDKGFMQHCQMSLAQLIESRYNTKMYFPEENVISLLESIVYAMAALEVKQIRHHDIYPTNIFFHNGIFKLSNPSMTPQSSYSLTLQRKRFSFLSPELIIYLREEVEDVKEDLLFRADVFSFGMTLLEFCSLKPSSECYDQDNYDIIDIVIKRRLAEIRQIYNPKIADAIDCLLKYQIQQRMTAFEFSKHLNQHVHQHQMEIANSKKSQMTIQPELQSPPPSARQPPVAPGSLPQGAPQLQPPQTQIIQGQKPQQIVQGEHQIQMRQQAPSPPPQMAHQYHLQQQPPSQQIQSQSNSQLRILQPVNKPPTQSPPPSLQYQPPPFQTLTRPNPPPPAYVPSSAQEQLPSYPYIQSPINPATQPLSYQLQRQYFTNPPPPLIEVESKPYPSSANDFLNKYSSPGASSYNTTTYTNSSYQSQSYSSYNPPVNHKTLGQLEYNIPSYKDDFMKAERDVGHKEIGGGYKSYREQYKESSNREIGGYNDAFKDKDWNQIKNDLSSKYAYGSPLSGSLSSRNEEESLEERVRRILEKSKQIK